MGINQKLRTLEGAVKGAGAKADEALRLIRSDMIFTKALADAVGMEIIHDPVPDKPGYVTTRFRRRLPRWLAWVRRLGVCR